MDEETGTQDGITSNFCLLIERTPKAVFSQQSGAFINSQLPLSSAGAHQEQTKSGHLAEITELSLVATEADPAQVCIQLPEP